YQTARTYLLKSFMRGGGAQLFSQALLAAVYGQLEEREAADKAVREVLALNPDFFRTVRSEFAKWYLPELVEQLMEGLGKAGLKVEKELSTSLPATESRSIAESSLSIAVL